MRLLRNKCVQLVAKLRYALSSTPLKKPPPSPPVLFEGAGDNAGLIFVAETEEAIVFVSVFLIYANVEVVPGFAANWIRQEIEPISINIRQRVQFRDRNGESIELRLRNHVYRVAAAIVASKWNAAETA